MGDGVGRAGLDFAARVETEGHEMLDGRLREVTLGGAFVETLTPAPAGTTCRITVELTAGQVLSGTGVVVHSDGEGMSLRFRSVSLKKSPAPGAQPVAS